MIAMGVTPSGSRECRVLGRSRFAVAQGCQPPKRSAECYVAGIRQAPRRGSMEMVTAAPVGGSG